jgi:hypothetical protein
MSEQKNNEAYTRAAELRKQIDELLKPRKSDEDAGDCASSPSGKKPPREFIHERMRELDQNKGGSSD